MEHMQQNRLHRKPLHDLGSPGSISAKHTEAEVKFSILAGMLVIVAVKGLIVAPAILREHRHLETVSDLSVCVL